MRWLLLITCAALAAADGSECGGYKGPCQHEGVCVRAPPIDSCLCLGPYHGERCELPTIDFCATAVCPMGQWCFNGATNHTCECSQLVNTDVCRRLPLTDDEARVQLAKEAADLTEHDIMRARAQWGPLLYRQEAPSHEEWIQHNVGVLWTWYDRILRHTYADWRVLFTEFDKRYSVRAIHHHRVQYEYACIDGGRGNRTALVAFCQAEKERATGVHESRQSEFEQSNERMQRLQKAYEDAAVERGILSEEGGWCDVDKLRAVFASSAGGIERLQKAAADCAEKRAAFVAAVAAYKREGVLDWIQHLGAWVCDAIGL